jgi:hypothetical protein
MAGVSASVPSPNLACADCDLEARLSYRGKLVRGRCNRCYQRHVKALKEAGVFASRRASGPLLERLLARGDDAPDGCTIWTGALTTGGYGLMSADGRDRLVHRIAYELLVGPIPEGAQVDHTCHNRDLSCSGGPCLHRRCINPHHLEAVTGRENTLRSTHTTPGGNARKSHCAAGHAFDETNTYLRPTGGRACKRCMSERSRAFKAKSRARREKIIGTPAHASLTQDPSNE